METDVYAIIIFVDIRGFTKWSDSVIGNENCSDLVEKFYETIQADFDQLKSSKETNEKITRFNLKQNGDGAMIILETSSQDSGDLIDCIIATISNVNKEFDNICSDLQRITGQETNLKLGWGLTRGRIKKIRNNDYIGSAVNRAARLCDYARPFGIVMGNPMFSPTNKADFYEDIYYAKGIDEPIKCWVTKEVYSGFVTREKRRETPEVHVAGVCYKIVDGKHYYLIAKRNSDRKLYPNKFECCGGQLRQNETFKDGVKRHFKTEMNINVNVLDNEPIIYLIVKGDEIINGLCYCCEYIDGSPKSPNHSDIQWCNYEQLQDMNSDLFIKDFYNKELMQFANILEHNK
jgi:class 3 adenylate cyclase/ADP-ribose pyrophosphatase YjhB (NUDIX family)